ncbi:hypothetical protein Lalb_Chr00c21g0405291 (mitochondrion) [Lupinus albus]|uniref:Uncharacterized protein n=1 Tax=Lupinus albus TaxID=3870 RepID=A0A6A4N1I8_LUPAL|nr:hypothetical protein Lalb_Chr00c21g0405291 [Lupinus albus]
MPYLHAFRVEPGIGIGIGRGIQGIDAPNRLHALNRLLCLYQCEEAILIV